MDGCRSCGARARARALALDDLARKSEQLEMNAVCQINEPPWGLDIALLSCVRPFSVGQKAFEVICWLGQHVTSRCALDATLQLSAWQAALLQRQLLSATAPAMLRSNASCKDCISATSSAIRLGHWALCRLAWGKAGD